MSDLDEELAKAVREGEDAPAVAGPAPGRASERAESSPRRKGHWGLLVALLALGGGMLALLFTGFEGSAVYSKTVDQLMIERERLVGRNVRVQGKLVEGTLRKRDEPCEYRFTIKNEGHTVPVRYAQCVVPDTFRDVPGMAVDVTAEGQLTEQGFFQAKQIMAKCPSKYEEKVKNGEATPYDRPIPPIADAASDGRTTRL